MLNLVTSRCEGLELQSEDLWELCFTMITSNNVEEKNKLPHIWMSKSLAMHNFFFFFFFMCIWWWLRSSLVWCYYLCDHSHFTLWIELLRIYNHDKFNSKLVWFLILVNIWHQKTIVLESWWHAVTLHVKPYCPNIRKIGSLTFDDFQVFFCFECSINLKFKL